MEGAPDGSGARLYEFSGAAFKGNISISVLCQVLAPQPLGAVHNFHLKIPNWVSVRNLDIHSPTRGGWGPPGGWGCAKQRCLSPAGMAVDLYCWYWGVS